MIRKLIHYAIIAAILSVPAFSWAGQKAELKLRKVNPMTRCPSCGEYFTSYEDQNFNSLQIYSAFLQDNEYNIAFWGPRGSTVTVFGGFNYETDRGFLIINKSDDSPVFIDDFQIFKANKWTKIPAEKGTTGGYLAYLQPYQDLQKWLSSIKWGQWWDNDADGN